MHHQFGAAHGREVLHASPSQWLAVYPVAQPQLQVIVSVAMHDVVEHAPFSGHVYPPVQLREKYDVLPHRTWTQPREVHVYPLEHPPHGGVGAGHIDDAHAQYELVHAPEFGPDAVPL